MSVEYHMETRIYTEKIRILSALSVVAYLRERLLRRWPLLLATFIAVSIGLACQQTHGSGGATHKLGPNDDLQRAIDRAQPGDVIVVEANAVYTGPFTLPKKSG